MRHQISLSFFLAILALSGCGNGSGDSAVGSKNTSTELTDIDMSLSCSLLGGEDSSNFQIAIGSIQEPSESVGTALLWTAKSEAMGDIPEGFSRLDDVSYGGAPGNLALSFQKNQLHLYESNVQENLVAGKWYESMISCLITNVTN